jgi:hypothetical protein
VTSVDQSPRPLRNRSSDQHLSEVGFPIRRSSDQSSFAAPRRLSQRTTSFIASQRQGIHRMPLSRLIALTADASPQRPTISKKDHLLHKVCPKRCSRTHKTTPAGGSCSGQTLSSQCQTTGGMPEQAHRKTFFPRTLPDADAPPARQGQDDGGARRDRTDDLMLAKHALSQLSYGPDLAPRREPEPPINGGPGKT